MIHLRRLVTFHSPHSQNISVCGTWFASCTIKPHWVRSSECCGSEHRINLRYNFKQSQGSPCCYLPVQEHKGIVMEQPSILSSMRTPMATATVDPTPPDRLGGLGTFSPVSPTEERSPDAVSSASEATEAGQSTHFIAYNNKKTKTTRIAAALSTLFKSFFYMHTKISFHVTK